MWCVCVCVCIDVCISKENNISLLDIGHRVPKTGEVLNIVGGGGGGWGVRRKWLVGMAGMHWRALNRNQYHLPLRRFCRDCSTALILEEQFFVPLLSLAEVRFVIRAFWVCVAEAILPGKDRRDICSIPAPVL